MTSPEWEAANEDDSDRFPQTPHASAPESTESHERGSRVVPDPARVARYAEAIFDYQPPAFMVDLITRRVMAVADEERAALVAEVERLRGQVQRVRALADAFADDGLARYGGNIAWHIEETIANEKGDFPDAADQRIASQRERAEAAEAKVAKVEALADEWDEHNEGSEYWRFFGPQVVSIPFAVRSLRAVLADAPAEQRTLNCPVCGSGEEGDCICEAAEAIAKAKWEASGLAVREGPWSVVGIIKRRSLIIKALPEAHEQREGGA